MAQDLPTDVAAILTAAGAVAPFAVANEWEPPTPDQALVIREYAYPQREGWGVGPVRIRLGAFQVRVRDAPLSGGAAARAQMLVVRAALEFFFGTVNATYYIDVRALSSHMYLGRDELGRDAYVQNYRAIWSY